MRSSVFYRFITRLLPAWRRRAAAPSTYSTRGGAASATPPALIADALVTRAAATVRAVPLQVRALSQMLDTEADARRRLRHLALLESACLAHHDDPFSRLPARTLDVASRQLELAAERSPSLDVLRMQLERYRQEQRSRIEAALSVGDQAAMPAIGRLSFSVSGPWTDTEFLETQPFERV